MVGVWAIGLARLVNGGCMGLARLEMEAGSDVATKR